MSDKILLGDLGGTNLRLAVLGKDGPENIKSYPVSEWPGLPEAMADYGVTKGARFYLSLAIHEDVDGVYQFQAGHKSNPWKFRKADVIAALGLDSFEVLHDFYATALAMLSPRTDIFKVIHAGKRNDTGIRVITGIGTGLGHGFADPVTGKIHETFGGHTPPMAVTDEQNEILKIMRGHFTLPRTFIVEEILSSRGFIALHRAVCERLGVESQGEDPNAFDYTAPEMKETCRLFSEFFGLYAHTICMAAHAFGGLHVCGGVIETLDTKNAFDWKAFQSSMRLNMVPVVAKTFDAMPVYCASLPNTALYGLAVHAQKTAA